MMQCFNNAHNIYQPDQDDSHFYFFIVSLCLEPLRSFFLVLHETCNRDFDRMILWSLWTQSNEGATGLFCNHYISWISYLKYRTSAWTAPVFIWCVIKGLLWLVESNDTSTHYIYEHTAGGGHLCWPEFAKLRGTLKIWALCGGSRCLYFSKSSAHTSANTRKEASLADRTSSITSHHGPFSLRCYFMAYKELTPILTCRMEALKCVGCDSEQDILHRPIQRFITLPVMLWIPTIAQDTGESTVNAMVWNPCCHGITHCKRVKHFVLHGDKARKEIHIRVE